MKANKKLLHTLKQQESQNYSIWNDDLWYYFNLTALNWSQLYKGSEKERIKSINDVRELYFKLFSAPNILKKTKANRRVLKEYYDRKEPVFWIATAGDISLPQGRQSGNLLLYHVAIEKKFINPNMIQMMYSPKMKQFSTIDYHAWLRISDIKYFETDSDKDYLDISYGDVLFGSSMVKKYKDKNNRDSYTLGTTIIRKCGVIKGTDFLSNCSPNNPAWMSMYDAKVLEYDHYNTEMLHLEYTKKALQAVKKITQHKKLSVSDITNGKFYLMTKYKKKNTFNYHKVITDENVADTRKDMQQCGIENREYVTVQKTKNSNMTVNVKLETDG